MYSPLACGKWVRIWNLGYRCATSERPESLQNIAHNHGGSVPGSCHCWEQLSDKISPISAEINVYHCMFCTFTWTGRAVTF